MIELCWQRVANLLFYHEQWVVKWSHVKYRIKFQWGRKIPETCQEVLGLISAKWAKICEAFIFPHVKVILLALFSVHTTDIYKGDPRPSILPRVIVSSATTSMLSMG